MKENKLFQVSTLNALMMGDYEGSVKVKELLKHADTGIGTFDGLDGEAIFYKGKAYNGRATGEVSQMDDEDSVPFACVCKFDEKSEEKEKQKKLFISRAIQYNEVCETKQETFETVVSGNKRAA